MRSRISRGGQISIPAEVRKRWSTSRVQIDDRGDSLVVRPLPEDPVAAARGSFKLPPGMTLEKLRAKAREEEASIEARRTSAL
jgi:bifunctional DNA-binding transcriptional regulator/antitoxin component of YhaV-PrlF toxin-antitoxin module